jgi:hypothetical protein
VLISAGSICVDDSNANEYLVVVLSHAVRLTVLASHLCTFANNRSATRDHEILLFLFTRNPYQAQLKLSTCWFEYLLCCMSLKVLWECEGSQRLRP